MIWVLIATTWTLLGSNVLVNVSTKSYPTQQECEAARTTWKPTNPVTTWGVQCVKAEGQLGITLNIESKP